MQMDGKEPSAVPAVGEPPSICHRLKRAFHTRPAFRPLRRLTVRHQDGGAAPGAAGPTATAAGGAPGAAATHGGPPPPVPLPPPTPVPSPAGTTPAPTAPWTLPPVPKPAANKGDKSQRDDQAPVSNPTVTATTNNVAEKAAAAAAAAGGMPVPVPPPAVTGRHRADAKAVDNAQQTKGKTRVGSRVRKALSSK